MDPVLARQAMVDDHLRARGITDERILEPFLTVPRHRFVDEYLKYKAYDDCPLSIGHGQTISQPYMVALMTEALAPRSTDRILEIGTGSGYQASILSRLCSEVISIERISTLAIKARRLILDDLGYYNVRIHVGDGTRGWPKEAPYDGIIVTAGAPHVPSALIDQLVPGGRLIIPVGSEMLQDLKCYTKTETGYTQESLGGCRFVKLIGENGWTP